MRFLLFLWVVGVCRGHKFEYFPAEDYGAPQFAILTPEEIEILKKKDEFFGMLNNNPQLDLAKVIMKMDSETYITALKGFSILGSLAAREEEHNKHLNSLKNDSINVIGNTTELPKTTLTTTITRKAISSTDSRIGNITLRSFTNVSKNQSVKGILETALEVFSNLNNATDHTFYDVLFQAVSMVCKIANESIKGLDEDSLRLLEDFKMELTTLSEKVYSNTDFVTDAMSYDEMMAFLKERGFELVEGENRVPLFKVKIDEAHFNKYVVIPVNDSSHFMIAYIENNTSKNKEHFLKHYDKHYFMSSELIYIFGRSAIIGENIIDYTEHDQVSYNEIRSNITRYFFQMHIINYFFNGFQANNTEYFKRQDSLDSWFEEDKIKLFKAFKQISDYYNDTFFQSPKVTNIVKSVLGESGGTNCGIAQEILKQVNDADPCKCRNYVVIVSDGVSKKDQYASVGLWENTVKIEEYNGKTLILWKASKSFKKNRKTFLDEDGRNRITADADEKFDWNNLRTLLDYAIYGENEYQMAVFRDYYNPCLQSTNESVFEHFEMRPHRWGVVPNPFKLWFAIVF